MNVYDSERMYELMEPHGYAITHKYDDADLAQEFLEELRGLGSIVVRYDDYIGDIKVTSDRGGDAIVTWVWPAEGQGNIR